MINVTVTQVQKKAVRPFIEATGSLSAFQEVVVSAEIDGIVKMVNAEEGSSVAKGKQIALIDDTDYTLDLKRAEAALRQAEASLAKIKTEYERKRTLFKEELVTKQQFEDVQMQLELATLEVEKAKASLDLLRQRLQKTKVYAPLSGYVKTKKVSAGDFVKAGTPLFVLIQSNPMKVLFTVNEKDLAKIKVGQEVSLVVDSLAGSEFKAMVHALYPNIDEKTRSLTVEARLPNDKGLLRPGLFAKVTIYTERERDALLIPATAILYEADKLRVFIVEDNRAKARPIKTGLRYGEYIEAIEGLKEGDLVVTIGQQNLSEGVKVNVAR
jgi:membrane fusion protein (multidrug efflux system)